MELNELKNIWNRQEIEDDMDYSREELLMLLNNNMVSFEEKIKSRDRREIIAALIVISVFGAIFFITPFVWQKVGSGIIILAGFYIWYKLKKAQRKKLESKPTFDHTLRDHLEDELQWVKKQKRMIEQVAWWYIVPISLGLIVFALSFGIIFKITYIILVVLLGAGIWKLNQRAVAQKFNPLIEELQDAISVIENSNK